MRRNIVRKVLLGWLVFAFSYSLGILHGAQGADIIFWSKVMAGSMFGLLFYSVIYYFLWRVGVTKSPG